MHHLLPASVRVVLLDTQRDLHRHRQLQRPRMDGGILESAPMQKMAVEPVNAGTVDGGGLMATRKLTADVLANIIGTAIQGYQVEKARTKQGPYFTSDRYGILLGCNSHGEYATWQFNYDEDGNITTYWGHYFGNRDAAVHDYETRDQSSQTFSAIRPDNKSDDTANEPLSDNVPADVANTVRSDNESADAADGYFPAVKHDIETAISDFERLQSHVGHSVEVIAYGDNRNVSIECMDCCEVLYSLENPLDMGD